MVSWSVVFSNCLRIPSLLLCQIWSCNFNWMRELVACPYVTIGHLGRDPRLVESLHTWKLVLQKCATLPGSHELCADRFFSMFFWGGHFFSAMPGISNPFIGDWLSRHSHDHGLPNLSGVFQYLHSPRRLLSGLGFVSYLVTLWKQGSFMQSSTLIFWRMFYFVEISRYHCVT